MSAVLAILLLVVGGVAVFVQTFVILRAVWYRKVKFPKKLRPAFEKRAVEMLQRRPPVAVLIPCKGISEDFARGMQGFLAQDYKNFSLIYITESHVDPAAPYLAQMAARHDNLHHVIAGEATHSCQKNHNLLAGLDYLKQLDIPAEIYVFADGDIVAQNDWLQRLISPLADPGIFATSGFRWLIPRTKRFGQHLHAAFNAYLGVAMTEDRVAAIWGGSMALTRSNFEKYGVAEKWSTAMVDDVALTWIIQKHKLRRVFVADCMVTSRETLSTVRDSVNWFVRQCQFGSQYIRPAAMFGAALMTLVVVALWSMPVLALLALFGLVPWWLFGASLVCYVLNAIGVIIGKQYFPDEHSPLLWAAYMPGLLGIGAYCGCAGLIGNRMVWANIAYEFNRAGEILSVTRLGTPAPAAVVFDGSHPFLHASTPVESAPPLADEVSAPRLETAPAGPYDVQ